MYARARRSLRRAKRCARTHRPTRRGRHSRPTRVAGCEGDQVEAQQDPSMLPGIARFLRRVPTPVRLLIRRRDRWSAYTRVEIERCLINRRQFVRAVDAAARSGSRCDSAFRPTGCRAASLAATRAACRERGASRPAMPVSILTLLFWKRLESPLPSAPALAAGATAHR